MSAIDPIRLARAIHLDAGDRGGGVWHIMGSNNFHVVTDGDSGLICDCEDFLRGNCCKHILRTLLGLGDPAVIEGLRKLIPNPQRFPAKRRQGAA